jgi:hypothetical protein
MKTIQRLLLALAVAFCAAAGTLAQRPHLRYGDFF